MTLKSLGLQARDVVYVGTFLVGMGATFSGISWRLSHLERSFQVLDNRLWELQRRGPQSYSSLSSSDQCHVPVTAEPLLTLED